MSDPRLSERAQRSLYSRGSMRATAPDQTDLQTGTEGSENQVSSRGCLGTVKPSRRRSLAPRLRARGWPRRATGAAAERDRKGRFSAPELDT